MGCSNDNYWKLDKWDKIGIASLIVFFTIFVVLNTFSFSAENVEMHEVPGVIVVDHSNFFITGGGSNYGTSYFEVEQGYIYKIKVYDGAGGVFCAFGDEVPSLNVPYYNKFYAGADGAEYSFIVPYDFKYVYFYGSWSRHFTVTKERVGGMDNTVELLAQSITPGLIWDKFKTAIPYISIIVLFSFGIYLITHAIREISKGRDV